MKFIYYDLIFLVLFGLIVGLFLYRNRKKLQIESKVLLLYKTSFGLDFIERMSKKSPAFFRIISLISIICGYLLMLGGIWLLIETVRLIWTSAIVIKMPPLMPLVPYLPSLFKIEFLPPFYFTYWIISIAIVAICHEFMHGVFARFYDVKLKSTGFGFLGPFIAAFVELDEKKMEKKPIKAQLAVLSGGSFANLILSAIFIVILSLFFASAFMQAGVIIPQLNIDGKIIVPSYTLAGINASDLSYNGEKINLTELKLGNESELKLEGENGSYYLIKEILNITPSNSTMLIVYTDTPAYNLKINGTIERINDKEIKNFNDFEEIMSGFKPGENITLETSENNYTFSLAKDPANSSRAVMGIGFPQEEKRGLIARIISSLILKTDKYTYYKPIGEFSVFIYNLLLWIVLINISVMLVNMLPFSIFDGGRFFYLSVLGLTGSKKKSAKWFKIANTFILLILIAMMLVWVIRI
jgi:membrane-associated protease RseP (regulator of RpoE activity)